MTEPTRPSLSIIIPAYNEGPRLGRGLAQLREYARRSAERIEVIVVDDGSRDDTAAVAEGFERGPMSLRVLRNDRNRGKGYSVRRGMLAASGEVALMCDADLSTPIEEVAKLLYWLERGYDVAIGSRDMPDSVLAPAQPWHRRLPAMAFRALRRRLMLRDIRDTQCGFKCFRRGVVREVFSRQVVHNFAFDCEVLALARRLGYRLREVGVVWCNDPASRVHPVRDPLRAVLSLIGIAWRLWRVGRS